MGESNQRIPWQQRRTVSSPAGLGKVASVRFVDKTARGIFRCVFAVVVPETSILRSQRNWYIS
jgi:hypothetical protein